MHSIWKIVKILFASRKIRQTLETMSSVERNRTLASELCL